jgi:hypothetical protein
VTLWLQRSRLLRCAAGQLEMDEERRLRRHLARCRSCRRYYDRVSLAAEALGSPAPRRRERARLLDALDHPPGAQVAPRRRWPRWLAPALVVPAAAALLFLRLSPAPDPSRQGGVTMRGGGSVDSSPGVRLLLHASRKGPGAGPPGPLRLIADLPGAGEARLSLRDYLQIGYAGLTSAAYVTVVAVDEAGEVHQYLPRPGAGPLRALPAPEARGLGPSVDLGNRHRAGSLRLFALFSPAPLDEDRVRTAAARAGLTGRTLPVPPGGQPVQQLTGLVTLEP